MKDTPSLEPTFGLLGAVAIVVGGVIGIGIFVLVAPASAEAGSSLWLAVTLALVCSVVGAIPIIQLASALPRAGGGYLFTSRLLTPLLGVLASNWVIVGGTFSSVLVIRGVADYLLAQLGWDFPGNLVAALMVLLLYGVFRLGMRAAISLQVIMVAELVLVLLIYVFFGTLRFRPGLSLDMPQGFMGFFKASILAYTLCTGMQVLGEFGEDVINARRNIPSALFFGGIIILVLYAGVGNVFIHSLPYDYQALADMEAPLKRSAELFLPRWFGIPLSVGVVFAGLTSLSAGAAALPREIFAQARDGILPGMFARVDPVTRNAVNAVGLYFVSVAGLALGGFGLDFCGYLVAIGFSLMSIMVSVASLRLIKVFPERHAQAFVRFPQFVLLLCAVVSVLSCAGLTILVTLEQFTAFSIYVVLTLSTMVYYVFRKGYLSRHGVDIVSVTKQIPGRKGST